MTELWQRGGFGIYLHWPFCEAKCPYCDFNSFVAQTIDHDRWTRAYLAELGWYRDETGPRILSSVFFGGGTPSLMQPQAVAAILDDVARLWPQANDMEVTLEANPSSVEAGKFQDFRSAGINRVSLGVQALNDTDLHRLGRLHSVKEAYAALETARSLFNRVSFDLIYARQDQSLADWEAELASAFTLEPDHLSLYQLTIEDGTAFGDRFSAGKLRGLPDEDLGADMYEATQVLCENAGLEAYEVSNHAKSGAESRHNLIYWKSGDYAGVGPGAHGRLTLDGIRYATDTHLAPGKWLNAVEAGRGEDNRVEIPPSDQLKEAFLMGLRVLDGVEIDHLTKLGWNKDNNINNLVDLGLLEITPTHLRATPKGRPILNSIVAALY